MSKSLVAAGVGLFLGAGLGLICGIVGTASLPNEEIEKLRKDIGIPIVPKKANTAISKEEKVEG